MKKIFSYLLFLFIYVSTNAQSITNAPIYLPSSADSVRFPAVVAGTLRSIYGYDIAKTAIPRKVTVIERNAMAGMTAGTMVYVTNATRADGTVGVYEVWNGFAWKPISDNGTFTATQGPVIYRLQPQYSSPADLFPATHVLAGIMAAADKIKIDRAIAVTPYDYGAVNDSTVNNNTAFQLWWAQWGIKPLYLPSGVWNIGFNRLVIPRKGGYLFGDGKMRSIIKSNFYDSTGLPAVNQINGLIYGDTSWTNTTIRGIGFVNYATSNNEFLNQALLVCYMGNLDIGNPSFSFVTENVNISDVYFHSPELSWTGLKFYSKRATVGGTLRRVTIRDVYAYQMGYGIFDFAGGWHDNLVDNRWLYQINIQNVIGDDLGRENTYGFAITSETSHSNYYAHWRISGYKNIGMELFQNSFTHADDMIWEKAKANSNVFSANGFSTHRAEGMVISNQRVKDTATGGFQIQHQDNIKLYGNTIVFGTNGNLILFNNVTNSSVWGDTYDNRTAAGGTTVIVQGATTNLSFRDVTIRSDSANGGAGVFSTNLVYSGAGTSGNTGSNIDFKYGAGGGTFFSEASSAAGNFLNGYSVNGVRTEKIYPSNISLTDAATITVNALNAVELRVTLGGNRTMAAPTNGHDGQTIRFKITQDGTGSRTITWNAAYQFNTTFAAPTLSTAINTSDYVQFTYNATSAKWHCTGFTKGL